MVRAVNDCGIPGPFSDELIVVGRSNAVKHPS